MEELFSLLRVKRLAESKAYDVLIIDCAPRRDRAHARRAEILNFYFKRIFPIQKTVLRSCGGGQPRHVDAAAFDDVLSAVKRVYDELEA